MKILLPVAFLIVASFAQAQDIVIKDGNSLAEGLRLFDSVRDAKPLTSEQTCAGFSAASYVNGFLGAGVTWETLGTNSPFRLPKTGVETIQAIKIVQKFLNDHPEELHAPADGICFIALARAFPNPDFQQPDYQKRLQSLPK